MTLLALTMAIMAGFLFGAAAKNDDCDAWNRHAEIIIAVALLLGAFAVVGVK